MKQLVLLFSLVLFAGVGPFQQGEETPIFNEGPVFIKGNFANAKDTKVLLQNPELTGEVELVTHLDDKGNFEFQLEVLSAHDITLRSNGKTILVFAMPRDSIVVKADMPRFEETLTFDGSNAGTNKSLNDFFSSFRKLMVKESFLLNKRDMPPNEFKAFANDFFQQMQNEISAISDQHKPDRHGIDWMKNYVRYRRGEDLLEYGNHHEDHLPADYYDFESDYKEVGRSELQCSQYYSDFMLKYHLGFKLSKLPEFPEIIKQYQDQTYDGVKNTFEFLDKNVPSELAANLAITQFMSRLVDSDHETAKSLFDVYASIVTDATSQNFIKRRIEANSNRTYLVNHLDDLEKSKVLGDLFKEIASRHKGKVLYIDIWATWCGACINTFPYSKSLSTELEQANVQPVYLCTNSEQKQWRQISEKFELPAGANFYLTREQSQELSRLFDYHSIPRYIIVDQSGEIVDHNAKQPFSRALKADLLRIAK